MIKIVLKNCSTALFVKDIEVSKDFYTNILQFSVEMDFGKNIIFKNGVTIWEIQTGHLIPTHLGYTKITDPSVNRFELYFETDNLTQTFDALKSKNVRFLNEIHEEVWGQRTIRFFDPDNHLIEVGETLKQFVCRFFNQGLTVEEISQRTHIPAEEVRRLINNSF
jgi:catechol 2,3-dioxygenase-like lactoylglutathione lyase family enzyme